MLPQPRLSVRPGTHQQWRVRVAGPSTPLTPNLPAHNHFRRLHYGSSGVRERGVGGLGSYESPDPESEGVGRWPWVQARAGLLGPVRGFVVGGEGKGRVWRSSWTLPGSLGGLWGFRSRLDPPDIDDYVLLEGSGWGRGGRGLGFGPPPVVCVRRGAPDPLRRRRPKRGWDTRRGLRGGTAQEGPGRASVGRELVPGLFRGNMSDRQPPAPGHHLPPMKPEFGPRAPQQGHPPVLDVLSSPAQSPDPRVPVGSSTVDGNPGSGVTGRLGSETPEVVVVLPLRWRRTGSLW